MRLSAAISPCPNDTFMFHALLHGLVEARGVELVADFMDIEELNRAALEGRYQVCKVSYAIIPQILDRYAVLGSGSALGRGNGPVFVAGRGDFDAAAGKTESGKRAGGRESVGSGEGIGPRIALPGEHTTANLLLSRFFPHLTNKEFVWFADIVPAILRGDVEAGVLIHEGRFTYREHGLSLVADLGELWEERTGMALPLGAIVVRRDVELAAARRVQEALSESIKYGFAHPGASRPFIKEHAQESSDRVIDNHIELFVNGFSVDLGEEGRRTAGAFLGVEPGKIFLE